MNLLWSRNSITIVAILAFIAFAWVKAERLIEKHDANVEQRAVAQTVTKIETANDNAISAGQEAARKSVAPPLPPARKPLGRVRKPVAGAVVDPTAVND